VIETLGQQAVELLQGEDYSVEYATYPILHSVCMEEITDISTWLQKQLSQ
jgi:phospholipase/carboxylesterase